MAQSAAGIAIPRRGGSVGRPARQSSSEFVVKGRRFIRIHAQLDDGNVGVRVNVGENRPRAVVQSPALVGAHGHRGQRLHEFRRERRIAGRRIEKLLERPRKAAEIVDRRRPVHRGNAGAVDIPVR